MMNDKVMRLKPARFAWFAVKSRQYMKGQGSEFREGFWNAWKKFNNAVEHDLNKCDGCCECD